MSKKIDGPGITQHYASNSVRGGRLDEESVGRFASLASRIRLTPREFSEMRGLYERSGAHIARTGHGVSFDDYLAAATSGELGAVGAHPEARQERALMTSKDFRGARHDAPDLSAHEANDSKIAKAVQRAFLEEGNSEPRKILYLDAVRAVRRYRWRDEDMLRKVAAREVRHVIEQARATGLEIKRSRYERKGRGAR